jgi:valyl-tRNA synthetase
VKVENLTVDADLEKPKASASAVVKGCDIYIPLEGLIDLDVERQRLEKEINRLEGLLNGVSKKLSNEKFVNNAPADVVEKEKAKQHDWTEQTEKLKKILEELK